MYVVVTRISVDPAHADEFAAAFSESMADHGGVPGLVRSALLAPSAPDGAFLSTMEFDSLTSYRAWAGSSESGLAHSAVVNATVVRESAVETFDVHTQV